MYTHVDAKHLGFVKLDTNCNGTVETPKGRHLEPIEGIDADQFWTRGSRFSSRTADGRSGFVESVTDSMASS